MEELSADAENEKKCAAIPPIMIHTCTPTEDEDSSSRLYTPVSNMLPQISPQTSILNGGQLPYQRSPASNSGPEDELGDEIQVGTVKEEAKICAQKSSCMFYNNNFQSQTTLHAETKNPPNFINRFHNHLSSVTPSSASNQHLQLPQCSYNINSIPRSPHAQSKIFSPFGCAKGRIKTEVQDDPHGRLPPLSGCTSGSNLDLDEVSPIIPSLPPYLGSSISEIPPIITSPSSLHLSRKRALSTSPLSDTFDICGFRSSPNSLIAAIYNNASNPITPNGPIPTRNGSIGHLGQPNTAMQYRVQGRKTSIEHNQNIDGTTNTTITNQITFSEHPNHLTTKYNTMSETATPSQKSSGTEPMELDHFNGQYNGLRSPDISLPYLSKNEVLVEPHVCLWKGCGLNFDDLEDLVQHIENSHIEKGKTDEYICLWQSCIRALKPFNARYKLLIHMRIHSGEKPNKCTVSEYTYSFHTLNVLPSIFP